MSGSSKVNFNLEIGDLRNLKGNSVIYWNITNHKEKEDEELIRILAVNFVISAFPLDDNLVTATFPPVGFEDREEFMLYIKQSQCDLIYAGELTMKKNTDYLKNLPDEEYYQLNSILNHYLEFYREKMDDIAINMSLKEKIYLLKKLVANFRTVLFNNEMRVKIPVNLNRIRKIIVSLKNSFNPFDLENFNDLIPKKNKYANKMIELYLEKFVAIHYEDYENAAELTQKIEEKRLEMENQKK